MKWTDRTPESAGPYWWRANPWESRVQLLVISRHKDGGLWAYSTETPNELFPVSQWGGEWWVVGSNVKLETSNLEDAMSTRAQIGFYGDEALTERPDALIYQHSDGHPTGENGLVEWLINICVPLIEQRSHFDPAFLAAQTLYRLIDAYDEGKSGLGFGIDNVLHGDTRFYYAVTSQGVYVFDARNLGDCDLDDLSGVKPMFFTSWKADDERRKVEANISALEAKLKSLYLDRESIKRRKP